MGLKMSKGATSVCAAALLVLSAGFATSGQTEAKVQNVAFVEDIGASERINFSGKLRMLSQRIPAAACYTHAGVEVEKSSKLLVDATAEFDRIITGLEFGDEGLGIKGQESDRKVLAAIKNVNEVWGPLHADIKDVAVNGGTDAEVEHLANDSAPLLANAKRLVSELVGEYSDPTALLQSDAITIDIAGRQRMLAQRISKNVCLITSGYNVEAATKEMQGARQVYDASVNALRHGLPEAGIVQSQNPVILEGLDDILKDWAAIQPIIDTVAAGQSISDEQKAFTYNLMNGLTGKMNRLVGIYNEDSKLGL